MGLFASMSSVVAPGRQSASAFGKMEQAFWNGDPIGWFDQLVAAGVNITPELALTLTYVHCAVSTISDDFGTMSCQVFRDLGDSGRQRVKYSDPGIGGLAYKMRWQPNIVQTAKAFWSTLCWQWLLRPAAYAELVYRPGSTSFVDQIIPRHPDRVRQETLADGTMRYKLTEPNGQSRIVTADEMMVVRNTSTDGLNAISRTQFGARALASGLSLQEFTYNYFKKGATAALIAVYKGDKDEEAEADLHGSITRYMSGSENAGGLLIVPEDIDIKALGVEPEKAQLLGLKELSGRDVARLFKLQPYKLFISGTSAYSSQVQSAQDHVTSCMMPIAVEFEQAIQRDLIVLKQLFFAKFNMDYLLRADQKSRMDAYEIAIRSRVMRPSEARLLEDLPPDPALDKLSESDYRPGASDGRQTGKPAPDGQGQPPGQQPSGRATARHLLFVVDAAQRCVRRERVAVEKIAKRHATDVERWQVELKAFYEEHSQFVATTMRVPMATARAYAAQHGALLEATGTPILTDDWERTEAEELAGIAFAPAA